MKSQQVTQGLGWAPFSFHQIFSRGRLLKYNLNGWFFCFRFESIWEKTYRVCVLFGPACKEMEMWVCTIEFFLHSGFPKMDHFFVLFIWGLTMQVKAHCVVVQYISEMSKKNDYDYYWLILWTSAYRFVNYLF